MKFHLKVDEFEDGGAIPRKFTCEGENHSPALRWAGAPSETLSFALVVDDPDAPSGTWNHWLLWDLPARLSALPEGYRARSPVHSGTNDFGKTGYGGPCPPKGHGSHRYFFHLFALDVAALEVAPGATRQQLEEALQPHVLDSAEYYGVFERR